MHFNRTLLFSIALCVASAAASSVPLEARALKDGAQCVGKGDPCKVSGIPCCDKGFTCKAVPVEPEDPKKKKEYVVSDACTA